MHHFDENSERYLLPRMIPDENHHIPMPKKKNAATSKRSVGIAMLTFAGLCTRTRSLLY